MTTNIPIISNNKTVSKIPDIGKIFVGKSPASCRKVSNNFESPPRGQGKVSAMVERLKPDP